MCDRSFLHCENHFSLFMVRRFFAFLPVKTDENPKYDSFFAENKPITNGQRHFSVSRIISAVPAVIRASAAKYCMPTVSFRNTAEIKVPTKGAAA